MIIRTDRKLIGGPRHVTGEGFISIRHVLKADNMGFSLHKTVIPKGGPHHWHYKNHLEACYCVKGHGHIKNLDTGKGYFVDPGTCYILDQNDDHEFTAYDEVVLISVFNPPVVSREVHQKDGSYELTSV